MSDLRQTLLKQIAALRSRVDPHVLDRAQRAAVASQQAASRKAAGLPPQSGAAANPAPAPTADTVPYDKESAHEAVRLFLANRQDGGRFRTKLLDALQGELKGPYRR